MYRSEFNGHSPNVGLIDNSLRFIFLLFSRGLPHFWRLAIL